MNADQKYYPTHMLEKEAKEKRKAAIIAKKKANPYRTCTRKPIKGMRDIIAAKKAIIELKKRLHAIPEAKEYLL